MRPSQKLLRVFKEYEFMSYPQNHHYDNGAFKDFCRSLRAKQALNNRVLLVQIPQVVLDNFNRDIAPKRGYYNFPPTGLQCIYEAIKHRGLDIEILDLNFELLKRVCEDPDFHHDRWPEFLEDKLADFQPSIVGISCLFDLGIGPMLRSMNLVRQKTDAVIIGGGVIATYEWKNLLADDKCHFVVGGEGENKLNFLLDHLTGDDLGATATAKIYFREGDEFHETQGAPDVVVYKGDLIDSYEKIPIEEYYKFGSLNPFTRMEHVEHAPYAAIQLARGCRARCTFSSVRDFMGRGVRHRPIEDVIAEMEFLIDKRGVRHFEWLDDDPTFYHREFKKILQTIIDRKWDIRWATNNGVIAAAVDEELLRLMRDSHCIGFKVGIETGNPEMLRKIKKPAKHDTFLRLSRMHKRYPELFIGGNIMVGLPNEKFYQMMDSFKFTLEVNLDWAAMTACQMIRGASAFSDSGEYFESQMKAEGSNMINFIPSRNSNKGEVTSKAGVLRGLAVFRIDPEGVPDAEQIKEVWFTFNLVCNYIFNKNLMPGGRPDKFISWVLNARKAYPTNPYMCLFLSLAYVLRGDSGKAEDFWKQAIDCSQTAYWCERFEEFGLDTIVNWHPQTSQEVFDVLVKMQTEVTKSFSDWLEVGYDSFPGASPNAAHA